MKAMAFLILLTLFLIANCTSNDSKQKPSLATVKSIEEEYFGIKISDPYRYMENLQDSSVQRWFKLQADYARNVLNSIPRRQQLIDRMIEFDGRKSSQVNVFHQITDKDRYFYLKTTPSDQTRKLYFRDKYEGKEVLLYDPEKHSSDTSKKFVISYFSASYDGLNIAFGIAPNGSESNVMLIMEVESRKVYSERIDRCWNASPSWLPDGSGFLYNRLKSSDVHQNDRQLDSKTYLHKIGSDTASDREIFSRTKYPELGIKPEDIPHVAYDKDCNYIFGYLSTVDYRLNVYYAPYEELKKEKIAWKQLFKPEDEVYTAFKTDKEIYVQTAKGAPNFKIVKTSMLDPDLRTAEIVVPEDPERKLSSFSITIDGLYYTLTENGVKEEFYFLPAGEKEGRKIDLPFAAGTVDIRTKGLKFSDVWVNIMGWTNDRQRYRYSPQTNEFTLENLSSTAEYPEYDDLIVEELMIPSYDGVKVPLSLVYNKKIKKTGNNPVLIFGYGAYGDPIAPSFHPGRLLWAKNGGIFAIAHVRGGGELGDQWHKGGFKTTKPNTWKDLIASAEYLIHEKYTSSKKIAIYASSAGGILIGRALTERPDLFAAAIPEVGFLNILRLEESPNGPINTPEFGTVKDSTECMSLIEMDSYLKIKDGTKYPATLITAGMNDPRVIAWQPAKFAARLQVANSSDKPILFWTDFEAGHGIGNTKTKDFESLADVLSFAFWQTGHPDFQIK